MVNNYQQSLNFYDQTLKLIGIERLMTIEKDEYKMAGYGAKDNPFFLIGEDKEPNLNEFVGKARGFHVAFLAPNIQSIQAWYKKCIELGGTDNGKPRPRPEYEEGYYAAFITDPNGWRIEAVLHNYNGYNRKMAETKGGKGNCFA
jgi:catechol 2,3-dioxygenase-like lactoylglutathione lyase family enzyme